MSVEEPRAPALSRTEEEIRAIDVDRITPLEALRFLAELRAKLPRPPGER
ncbi:MAG: hypothetical protein LVQ64_06190 [Thermoplasmatales archaeon]|nr:hypothetical protein [Thermoplasmatales archaeon]